MMGGKMMARVEEDIAPTREMKRPMLGTAAANTTVKYENSETLIPVTLKNCVLSHIIHFCPGNGYGHHTSY